MASSGLVHYSLCTEPWKNLCHCNEITSCINIIVMKAKKHLHKRLTQMGSTNYMCACHRHTHTRNAQHHTSASSHGVIWCGQLTAVLAKLTQTSWTCKFQQSAWFTSSPQSLDTSWHFGSITSLYWSGHLSCYLQTECPPLQQSSSPSENSQDSPIILQVNWVTRIKNR